MDTDYSSDDGKRKRNTDKIGEEIFSKSKKIARSPDTGKKGEEKLDQLMIMMQTLMQDVKEMKNEQKEYREEIKQLKRENKLIKEENQSLRQKVTEINKKIDNMERDKRRNNIVVQGIEITTPTERKIKEEMENFIKDNLEIDIKIGNARKIGTNIVLIELGDNNDKHKIMKNKNKLKNIKDKRIYINDDMTKEEREIQKRIRMVAKEEKQNKRHVKVGFQKLEIENKHFKWNKETNSLETFIPKN